MKSYLYGLIALMIVAISGCGGGNDLFGNLSFDAKLVDDTGGLFHAESTAVYSNPPKDATGVELNFSINAYTASGIPIPGASSSVTIKQPAGGWTVIWRSIEQRNETIFIDLSVTTGDLSQFKRLTIPALSPLAATPAFVNLSTALSQTVTISGSVAPYIVFSKPSSVSAVISGSTLTISEATFHKLNGAVVVQSAIGDLLSISLRY